MATAYQDAGYRAGLTEAAELLTLAAARMPRTVTCDVLRAIAAQIRIDPVGTREQLTDKPEYLSQLRDELQQEIERKEDEGRKLDAFGLCDAGCNGCDIPKDERACEVSHG
jgi:hypothetical protein